MILGIDLGQKTTGLAISEGNFASPYKTIKHQSTKEAIQKISPICQELSVTTVVVGYVEGKIKSHFQNFVNNFKIAHPAIKVVMLDETFTTRQARDSMIKLQIPKTKRKEKEHQIAASIILETYLNSQ